jgi:hypothetical protein
LACGIEQVREDADRAHGTLAQRGGPSVTHSRRSPLNRPPRWTWRGLETGSPRGC